LADFFDSEVELMQSLSTAGVETFFLLILEKLQKLDRSLNASSVTEPTPGNAGAVMTAAGGGSSSGDVYETAYACEDSGLNITCTSGGRLNIIRANYGRFSIAICNVHGNTEWSVNCMSPRTLRVIRARCQGADSCQVPVDSTIFGDPCPGTLKYVEVHYSCELGEKMFLEIVVRQLLPFRQAGLVNDQSL
jgi:hypothetical protein